MIERTFSLREATRLTGISRSVLKRELEVRLALIFPPTRRGGTFRIRESQLEALMRLLAPQADWSRIHVAMPRKARVA